MKIVIVTDAEGFVSEILSDEPIDDIMTINCDTSDEIESELVAASLEEFEADPELKYHYNV